MPAAPVSYDKYALKTPAVDRVDKLIVNKEPERKAALALEPSNEQEPFSC